MANLLAYHWAVIGISGNNKLLLSSCQSIKYIMYIVLLVLHLNKITSP